MFEVGLIIPTKNRYIFLERLIQYYINNNTNHVLYIGDASDINYKNEITNLLKSNKSNIVVNYFYLPDFNDTKTIKFLANQIKENYCAFVGDDDFLVPASLSKCAEFLYYNVDYRTAQGKAILFELNEIGPYGTIKGTQVYWTKKEVVELTGVARLNNFSKNYWVPQFSVHRTFEYLVDSEHYDLFNDRSFGEIFHNFTFVLNGKSKHLDLLYLVRQTHNQRYLLTSFYDWILKETWIVDYKFFIDKISDSLISIDNIRKETAVQIANNTFKNYLISFSSKSNNSHKKNISNQFLNNIKKILLYIYYKLFYKNEFLKLLRRNSKYKVDALEIYNLITNNTYVKQ